MSEYNRYDIYIDGVYQTYVIEKTYKNAIKRATKLTGYNNPTVVLHQNIWDI